MKTLKAGLISGLVGGALDLVAAMIVYPAMSGITVISVPQSIASGLMGAAAYGRGMGAALLGAALHFAIAIAAGMVLAMAMRASSRMRQMAVATGVVFGSLMYVFMGYVVVPLSNAVIGAPTPRSILVGILIHIFIFGLPVAFTARRFLRDKEV